MNIPLNYLPAGLSPELINRYLDYGVVRTFRRGSFLLEAGEICKHIHFVESGLLRSFYRHGNKEISSWFALKGAFCWSAESFLKQEKGIEYIQVLEDAIVCSLSYGGIQCICQDFPLFNRMQQEVTERHLLACQQKMQAMWMQQSPQRLTWFTQQFPGLLERVSGKHIASYLGITEVMLSRLRHPPSIRE